MPTFRPQSHLPLYIGGISFLSLWAAVIASQSESWVVNLASLALGSFVLWRPALSVSLFILLVLPGLGGHYAGTPRNAEFGQLYSVLIGCLGWRWTLALWKSSSPLNSGLHHPLGLLTLLFVATIPASFIGLPYDEVLVRFQQVLIHADWLLFSPKEVFALYPVIKGFQMLQHLSLFYIVLNYPKEWEGDPRNWVIALLLSVVLVLFVGLLDFYGIVDLRAFRPLDFNVNPGNIQQRLQSFFGHSSWCAQYITIAIPSILILFTYPIPQKRLIPIVVGLLILGEFVLILAYQRGGWVSYPLTLIVVWFSVYVVRGRETGTSMLRIIRRSLLKISLSVPLTLLASLTLFTYITGELPHQYLERFKAISSMGDRMLYMPVTFDLASMHPILGGGGFSFTYRYVQEFLLPSGHFFSAGNPLRFFYNNAHSTYFAILSGQGFVGLFLYMGLIVVMVISPLRLVARGFICPSHGAILGITQRIYALMGLTLAMAFGLYGIVDDLFYISAPGFVFFLVLALIVRSVPSEFPVSVRVRRITLMAFLILFFFHAGWEYGYPAPARKILESSHHEGCYDPDSRTDGTLQRWCSPRFKVIAPIVDFEGRRVAFLRATTLPKADASLPVRITLKAKDEPVSYLVVMGNETQWWAFPVLNGKGKEIELEAEVDNGLVPLREVQELSLDRRLLSVALDWPTRPPEWDFKRSANCHPALKDEMGQLIQWCAEGGVLPITAAEEARWSIRVGDPSTSKDSPVWVWLRASSGSPRILEITDSNWHPLSEFGSDFGEGAIYMDVSSAGGTEVSAPGQPSRQMAFAIGRNLR